MRSSILLLLFTSLAARAGLAADGDVSTELEQRLRQTPLGTVLSVTLRNGEHIEAPLAEVTEDDFSLLIDLDEQARQLFSARGKLKRHISYREVESLVGATQPSMADLAGASERKRRVYAFFAPGARPSDGTATWAAGGGVDWFLVDGFALGLDGQIFDFVGCGGCGALIGSVHASYTFRNLGNGRLAPFVLAGAGSAVTGEGSIPVLDFGAGFNYWFRKGFGLRLELLNNVVTSDGDSYLHFRIGITF